MTESTTSPRESGAHISESGGPSWDGVVRWGGWSLFAAAALLVVVVVGVAITGQELPVPAEEALDSPGTATALFVVAALGDVLLAPGAIALYLALKETDRTRMLLATVLLLLATPMFLASRGPIISMSQLSDSHQGATDEAARSSYLAAAEFGIDLQNTYSTMAVILLSVGSIIAGTVMLTSGMFGRPIAYVTIAAGVCSTFTPFIVIMGGPWASRSSARTRGGMAIGCRFEAGPTSRPTCAVNATTPWLPRTLSQITEIDEP